MLGAGYNIYVIEDCCGATSVAAARQSSSFTNGASRVAVRMTTIQALLEWQRDWGQERTLRCANEAAQTAGRSLRRRRRIYRLYHGSSRAAIRAKTPVSCPNNLINVSNKIEVDTMKICCRITFAGIFFLGIRLWLSLIRRKKMFSRPCRRGSRISVGVGWSLRPGYRPPVHLPLKT